MFNTGNSIFVEGEKGLGNIEFDMTLSNAVERRVRDISTVTPMTAPELFSLITEAYLQVARYFAQLQFELDRATNHSNKRRAIVILDEVPEMVKEKQLGSARSPLGSEDIRESFVNKDDQWSKLQDRVAAIKATRTFMQLKLEGLDMAFTSVKTILSNTQQYRYSAALNGTIPEHATAGNEVVTDPQTQVEVVKKNGWAKPKY